jgi:peptide/nickel transport system permease protein
MVAIQKDNKVPLLPGRVQNINFLKKIPKLPRWVQRRIGFTILVLIAAIIINFILPRLMPGDITYYLIPSEASEELRNQILRSYGLDRSWFIQFLYYLKNIFTLNFGYSFQFPTKTVASMIGETLPRTLILLIPGEIIGIIIGYYLGVSSGWKAGSKKDSFITGFSLIIWAMPMFWTGMIVFFIFGVWLDWFPIRGYATIGKEFGFFGTILDRLYYLVLPMFTLATKFGASQLLMRNTMTITLKQNYIVTAKAKGLSENRIKHRHAARNAMIPLVTGTTLRLASMIAGLIFIETIFSYPGMGKLIWDGVHYRDYPLLQATFLTFAVIVIAAIFLLDIIYARLDPRIRYE